MERVNQSFVSVLASIAIVVASLHFAQSVLIPLAVAVLLSVVLTPPVRRVEKLGLGRIPAVVLVSALVFAGLFTLGWVVVGQATEVTSLLPEYRQNARAKLRSARESLGLVRRAAQQVEEFEKEIEGATGVPQSHTTQAVQVVEPNAKLLDVVRAYLGSVASPIATAALVVVLLVFILLQREDLRDRLLRVLGSRDLWLTTAAIDDASERVTRYLRAYTILNFGHGVVVASGLWFFGLPAALLFGLIAFIMRFVPYVGPWIAALLPVALSLAVFDGWQTTLLIVVFLAAIELVSNNVFEPWLYGSSVGLSPFAVIIAAVFWAWIWGPVGLVLAIPMTVCLVVMGRHVPQLQFLAILLGDEPALAPALRLYQRLLARDVDEADDLVESACVENGVDHTTDSLLLPALALLDHERRLGRLDENDLDAARRTCGSLAETLEACAAAGAGPAIPPPSSNASGPSVLCLPAGRFADEVACDLLARLLGRRGVRARATSRLLTGELLQHVRNDPPDIVLLSALPPSGASLVRYLCRRLLATGLELDVIVGAWASDDSLEELRKQHSGPRVRVVSTFAEASKLLVERSGPRAPQHAGLEPAAVVREHAAESETDQLLHESAERLTRRLQRDEMPSPPGKQGPEEV